MRSYLLALNVDVNAKGVLDLDTVKGCRAGMRRTGGCYGACYAAKIAAFRGLDFAHTTPRVIMDERHCRDCPDQCGLAWKETPANPLQIG